MNDLAGALSESDRARLESQLRGYEQGASQQIAVAIFRSLGGESVEDISIRLAEKWKIGTKKEANGVLVLLFLDEHKVRIEVGYGLEDKLTDAESTRVIREVIAPRLKSGDLAGGLSAGLAKIHEIIAMPGTARRGVDRDVLKGVGFFAVLALLIGGAIVVSWLRSRKKKPVAYSYAPDIWGAKSSGPTPPTSPAYTSSASSDSDSWSSSSSVDSSSGGGSDFSGGGGEFGGGGATGDW